MKFSFPWRGKFALNNFGKIGKFQDFAGVEQFALKILQDNCFAQPGKQFVPPPAKPSRAKKPDKAAQAGRPNLVLTNFV